MTYLLALVGMSHMYSGLRPNSSLRTRMCEMSRLSCWSFFLPSLGHVLLLPFHSILHDSRFPFFQRLFCFLPREGRFTDFLNVPPIP